jgi:hypothetical protein
MRFNVPVAAYGQGANDRKWWRFRDKEGDRNFPRTWFSRIVRRSPGFCIPTISIQVHCRLLQKVALWYNMVYYSLK